jgi:hypothetical protein
MFVGGGLPLTKPTLKIVQRPKGPDMPDQGSPPAPDPRNELRAFVFELQDLLQAIVENQELIPSARLGDVQRAWESVQPRFSELIAALDGPNIPLEQLEQHGLTGDELNLKRRGFRGRLFAWGRRINQDWVRSVLRWADTILGSLATVFPVAGAIKEFKESIENLIEDSVADARQQRRRERKVRRRANA